LISKILKTKNQEKETRNSLYKALHSAKNGIREQWVKSISDNIYRNEIEVEFKLIFPLLLFLGYSPNDLQIRVNVNIQVGREKKTPAADWIVWKDGKPYFVIEAKKPEQTITREVLDQARSYAYGLNLNKYVVTNGKKIEVYIRGNEFDTKILEVSDEQIEDQWENIRHVIGK